MPDATFLWITDQPELNEQTRKKMLATSSVLNNDNLVVIDSTFKDEMLRAGCLHFLNIQKLARNQPLVNRGNRRWLTIWETLNNTTARRRGHFVLIVDEAGRVDAFLPQLDELITEGLVIIDDVHVVKYVGRAP